MRTTLDADATRAVFRQLTPILDEHSRQFPGTGPERQPVHTVYGGAHLFAADSATKLGRLALRQLDAHAGDACAFARAIGLSGADTLPGTVAGAAALEAAFADHPAAVKAAHPAAWLAQTVWSRVRAKLEREPVEDFRLDFEDGFGHRGDDEEDAVAARAAGAVAAGLEAGTLPPFVGIRIKALDGALHRRAARTLDIFVSTLLDAAGRLPENFVVTLPKVVDPAQVAALVALFDALEAQRSELEAGSLKLELMVETAQSLIDSRGRAALPRLVAAAGGRCAGAHFGVYDYTAGLEIAAAHQTMDHLACDVARSLMQIALAGTGVHLSDGATNVMPVVAHRPQADGEPLSGAQVVENRRQVHAGWNLHYRHVRHSLDNGFYQGWDLHPAQLPTRYAAVYSFFLEGLDAAGARLSAFVSQAAQATLVGEVFDDAATGQGLLNVFLRGLSCGAITEDEALATGLTLDELHSRSFLAILEGRKG